MARYLLFISIIVFVVYFVHLLHQKSKVLQRSHARLRAALMEVITKTQPGVRIIDKGDQLSFFLKDEPMGELQLVNFYREAIAAGSAGEKDIINTYANIVIESVSPTPLTLEKDQDRILPRLVPGSFFNESKQHGIQSLHEPFFKTGLLVAFVVDSKTSVRYLTEDSLKELGATKEKIREIALQNLRKLVTKDSVQKMLEKNAMAVFKAGDGHDATRLLLIPECLDPGQVVAVAIPDSDTLVLINTTDLFDWNGFRKVAHMVSSRPLFDKPLRVTRDTVEVIE